LQLPGKQPVQNTTPKTPDATIGKAALPLPSQECPGKCKGAAGIYFSFGQWADFLCVMTRPCLSFEQSPCLRFQEVPVGQEGIIWLNIRNADCIKGLSSPDPVVLTRLPFLAGISHFLELIKFLLEWLFLFFFNELWMTFVASLHFDG
jgi:hypothetical protein